MVEAVVVESLPAVEDLHLEVEHLAGQRAHRASRRPTAKVLPLPLTAYLADPYVSSCFNRACDRPYVCTDTERFPHRPYEEVQR